jgi:hypothetical protein
MIDERDQAPEGKTSRGDLGPREVVPTAARRRLLKGGLSVAPVILTLTSRPVLGFDQMCLSPSRMISGNHSGFAGPITCGGSTRNDWRLSAEQNPKPAWAGLKFTHVFGTAFPYVKSGSPGNSSPDKLGPILLDSLAGNDGNANSVPGFASFIIAAYLNAFYGVGNVSSALTPAQAIHLWNDAIGNGKYCPQTTMCWDVNGVISYLKNSGIVPS